MLKTYLKIGWRNIAHNTKYSFINISGLAIGIAACLLIFLIVRFELSFDNFHKNAPQTYRVVNRDILVTGTSYTEAMTGPVPDALRLDLPQIAKVAALFSISTAQVAVTGPDA